MKSLELQSSLVQYLTGNSRYIDRRGYIGLSAIADCDRVLYQHYFAGSPGSVQEKLRCFIGYQMQDILERALSSLSIVELLPSQEISLYDGLIQGHTDGAIRYDGATDLIEIKSISSAEFMPDYRNVPQRHFHQVQAYMHFLNYEYGHIVYYARDNGELRVIGVHRNAGFGQRIADRVDLLAEAILSKTPPACSCGRCDRVRP